MQAVLLTTLDALGPIIPVIVAAFSTWTQALIPLMPAISQIATITG